MKTTISRVAALTLFALSSAVFAVIPEQGLWWNPAEGGRGYGIEMQDDSVFVTYYAYQPDGVKSAFYTTFGKLNSDTGVMTGYWAAAENGQCFGCPFRAPQLTDLGTARLEFSSPMTGVITLPGNIRIPIQRQLLVGQTHRDPKAMLGIWAMTEGALGVYFGDVLWLRRVESGPENRFSGNRVDASTRILLGGPTNSATSFPMVMLVDSSASYYKAYAFDNSLNRIIGRSWTYLKTSQLSGAGLPAMGHRLMGNTHAVQSTSAQGDPVKSLDAVAAEQRDHEQYLAGMESVHEDEFTIDAKSYSVNDMRQAIAELQSQLESR